jgi:hypothetical protein
MYTIIFIVEKKLKGNTIRLTSNQMATFLSDLLQHSNDQNPPLKCKNIYFFESIGDKDDVIQKYRLLQELDYKYNFIRDDNIYLLLEYAVFRQLTKISDSYEYDYHKYIDEFYNMPEDVVNEARHNITFRFICDIFKSYCTGVKVFSDKYVKNPLALCVAFGKKSLKKHIRRNIYNNLNHEEIINTKNIQNPIQSAILKIYCRFIILSGQKLDDKLFGWVNTMTFTKKVNTAIEDNTKYNKAVRLFNGIVVDPAAEIRTCNIITDDDKNDSLKVLTKSNNYYVIYDTRLINRIVELDELSESKRVGLIDDIDNNIDRTLITTTKCINKYILLTKVVYNNKSNSQVVIYESKQLDHIDNDVNDNIDRVVTTSESLSNNMQFTEVDYVTKSKYHMFVYDTVMSFTNYCTNLYNRFITVN